MLTILRLAVVVIIAAGLAAADFENNRLGEIPEKIQMILKEAVDVTRIGIVKDGVSIITKGQTTNGERPPVTFANTSYILVGYNDDLYVIVYVGADRFVYRESKKK